MEGVAVPTFITNLMNSKCNLDKRERSERNPGYSINTNDEKTEIDKNFIRLLFFCA